MREIETLEDTLEKARANKTPVALVLAGRIEAPMSAFVLGRNGQTFEFAIDGARIRMDVAHVVLWLAQ